MIFSVTRNGQLLDPSLYTWNERTKTFSTNENNLVLDFSNINRVTFKTGYNCTFKTGFDCTFNTGSYCTFNTESYCTFTTGSGCTFDTGSYCTFKTGSYCTFKTKKNCVVVRRDVFEVIQLLEEDNHIKLNGSGVIGYEKIVPEEILKHTITIDGKEIEISDESYENIKKLFK